MCEGWSAAGLPSGPSRDVYHRWQRWETGKLCWVDMDRLHYSMKGGRERSYRGSTRKSAVEPGHWRVVVELEKGRVLGRVEFRIVEQGDRKRHWKERVL